ncbi:MAG TPA: hypothetical protein VGH19_15460 [Verrucomicrobiae bacterium]
MIVSTWELFRDSLAWINLPFTVMLGGVVLYWLLVLIGMIDIDLPFFDGGDGVGDAAGGTEGGGEDEGVLQPVLKFLNIGEAPAMSVVTIMVLCMWIFAILVNRFFNPDHTVLMALGLFVPNLLVTAIITHFVAKPFAKMNRYLNTDYDKAPPMVGLVGTVMTSELDGKFGTINIDIKGAPLTVQARSENGKIYKQGDRVQVVREDKSSGIYFVVRN